MTSLLTTKQAIENSIRVLLYSHQRIKIDQWQGIELDAQMFELNNIFIQMKMAESMEELAQETKADLPWSEDHFQERMANDPEARNPGRQWLNWPYYSHGLDDARFRPNGLFAHTYQERFYPEKGCGRYENGNVLDVIERLKNNPTTRQAFLAIWHPEDQSNNGQRVPCTIGYWFKLNNGKLDLTYLIRSCDAVRHFRNDVYMTQRLAQFVSNKLGVGLGTMSMWIGSFHCFATDSYTLEKKLNK